jgi:hypothetical protein
MRVIPIKTEQVYPWLLDKHYAKRIPNIMFAFGLYIDDVLKGVITFGKPVSNNLCYGICGKEHSLIVLELNRLCLMDNNKNESSFLVANAIKLLPKPSIIVSYADGGQGHIGYVYQSTNFIYTGAVTAHDDEYMVFGKKTHGRTLTARGITKKKEWAKENNIEIVKAKPKHRYIFFHGSKTDKKALNGKLKYGTFPYPKGESKNYDAGGTVITQDTLF